jgi:NADH:ubiquinone oxidoreductase subunit 6 (subunit J)
MNSLEIIFWIFGVGILAGASLVAFSRNLIHAAGGLFLTLFSVAGIFVLSGADFLGIVQLIVYVGGILILILFTMDPILLSFPKLYFLLKQKVTYFYIDYFPTAILFMFLSGVIFYTYFFITIFS